MPSTASQNQAPSQERTAVLKPFQCHARQHARSHNLYFISPSKTSFQASTTPKTSPQLSMSMPSLTSADMFAEADGTVNYIAARASR